ncbi:MAG: multicopper oxidase domain-containing protein [Methanospirillum sp.]
MAALVLVVILISVLAAPTLARTTLAEAQAAAADPIGAALHAAATMTMPPSSGGMGESSVASPAPTTATPGAAAAVPGTIQAEDYNVGGQGFGWYDRTPGNEGGAYRHDDVDIETGASGFAVAYVKSSEWLDYAIDVAESGTYAATFRASSPWDDREIWVWVDGVLKAQAKVPSTGSFDIYENATASVALPAGRHTLRLEFYRDAQNLDLVTFALAASPTPTPTGNVTPTPTSNGTAPELLDPMTIPKYVNQLETQKIYVPTVIDDPSGNGTAHAYHITMAEFEQQVLPPGMPKTTMWGYGGNVTDLVTGEKTANFYYSPSAAFVVTRGIPSVVTWTNNITRPNRLPVDPTIHWADPNGLGMGGMPHSGEMAMNRTFEPFPPGYPEAQYPVPLVPHLHGGEVPSQFDGNPEAWWTWNGLRGKAYDSLSDAGNNSAVYRYPNEQQAAPLWYHDHALGITRLNVASGLAGGYLIKDPADPIEKLLPSGKYEVPLIIQDRTFMANGSFWFPADGINPDIHPYWNPENFGNTIMVNGQVWPNLDVDRGQYRFEVYDGSNARFYTMRLEVQGTNGTALPFTQVMSDGGYLPEAVTMNETTIAPGERMVFLVDFSGLPAGTKVRLTNSAPTPFPSGDPANQETTGQVMQFTVTATKGAVAAALPATLNAIPTLTPDLTRTLVLWESTGANGPLELLLNGQKWSAPITEDPKVGSTEEWAIVNPTMDVHPIHLHLVQFQLVSRQALDTESYASNWTKLNADLAMMGDGQPPWTSEPRTLDPTPFLTGDPMPPDANEAGWKDTIQMNPGEVTRIRARFAPTDGSGSYLFDATQGPGYVWHCHILDHEDNEMMRPYRVTA